MKAALYFLVWLMGALGIAVASNALFPGILSFLASFVAGFFWGTFVYRTYLEDETGEA